MEDRRFPLHIQRANQSLYMGMMIQTESGNKLSNHEMEVNQGVRLACSLLTRFYYY